MLANSETVAWELIFRQDFRAIVCYFLDWKYNAKDSK